jgi:putative chitinase
MVRADQLQKLGIGPEWVEPLNETFQRFNISNVLEQAAFIGQCAHESNNFRNLEEGLTYKTPQRLMAIFPRRFPTVESAESYVNNPKALGNKIYANRMGNRDEASGDGSRFCGRGLVQLTGSDAYFHCGKALGVDLWAQPELVKTPKYAVLTAGWFWDTHKCNALANAQDWVKLTKVINGGTIGLEDRVKRISNAIAALSS